MPTVAAVTMTGDVFHVDVGLYHTVSDLMGFLAEETGWPTESHELLWRGKPLQHSTNLSTLLSDGGDAEFELFKSRNISELTWYNRWVEAAAETVFAEPEDSPDFHARRVAWLRLAAASHHLGESVMCKEACRQAELAAGRYCLKVTDETMNMSPSVGMYMRKKCNHSAPACRKLLRALFDAGRLEEVVSMSWDKYLPHGYWTFLGCFAAGRSPASLQLSYQGGKFLVTTSNDGATYAVDLRAGAGTSLAGSLKAQSGDAVMQNTTFRFTYGVRRRFGAKKRTSPGSKRPELGERQWDWDDEEWESDWEDEDGQGPTVTMGTYS
eukprot:TRINITY_DN24119_c0_g1_i1.p1 TRINITY_DN24119_c0_g1~~TRINITY_DN24119_c0_g1_i1.p1  ORF type:complete len:324 (-),score=59.94 TRINITY_DN24119_c0_g1_i1:268-1239(-)